jgi:hypothetical protein
MINRFKIGDKANLALHGRIHSLSIKVHVPNKIAQFLD